nr:Di-heme cytochrome, transmembrane [Ipomoea batatas]
MALMVNAASLLGVAQHPFPSLGLTSSSPRIPSSNSFKSPLLIHGAKTRPVFPPVFALKNRYDSEVAVDIVVEEEEDEAETVTEKPRTETLLYSFTPLPLLFVAALPGAGAVKSVFGPFVELVKSLNLPDWLVHWGHPGNMAVVLFAMGGYGTYLGFRIRFSNDVEERAKAKDLHPKLLAGMFFFFALGATGGITSLLTSDKPILESPHAVTGLIGLSLLTIQTLLPALFEGNPGLRNVHGILGSGIMTLFLVHFALGLQLGLSY